MNAWVLWKDRIIITNQNSKKENKWQNKNCLKDFWDNNKHSNPCIKGVPKMRRENGVNNIFDEKKLNNMFEKYIFEVKLLLNNDQLEEWNKYPISGRTEGQKSMNSKLWDIS